MTLVAKALVIIELALAERDGSSYNVQAGRRGVNGRLVSSRPGPRHRQFKPQGGYKVVEGRTMSSRGQR